MSIENVIIIIIYKNKFEFTNKERMLVMLFLRYNADVITSFLIYKKQKINLLSIYYISFILYLILKSYITYNHIKI